MSNLGCSIDEEKLRRRKKTNDTANSCVMLAVDTSFDESKERDSSHRSNDAKKKEDIPSSDDAGIEFDGIHCSRKSNLGLTKIDKEDTDNRECQVTCLDLPDSQLFSRTEICFYSTSSLIQTKTCRNVMSLPNCRRTQK